jgi:hypothetical protein
MDDFFAARAAKSLGPRPPRSKKSECLSTPPSVIQSLCNREERKVKKRPPPLVHRKPKATLANRPSSSRPKDESAPDSKFGWTRIDLRRRIHVWVVNCLILIFHHRETASDQGHPRALLLTYTRNSIQVTHFVPLTDLIKSHKTALV